MRNANILLKILGFNDESWAYFWCGFKSHPIRAIQTHIMRLKVRNLVRESMQGKLKEMIECTPIMRAEGETDSQLRIRMQKATLERKAGAR